MPDPSGTSLDGGDHHTEQNDPQQDDESAEMARLMGFSSFTTTARTRRPRPSSISDEHPPSKRSRSDEGSAHPQVPDGTHPAPSPRGGPTRASCSPIIVTTDTHVDISPSPTGQGSDPFIKGFRGSAITAERVSHDEDCHNAAAAEEGSNSPNQGQRKESGSNPTTRGNFNARGRGNFGERGGRGGARGGRGGGGHNPNWYIDYYDSRSNENPWEPLEKKNGLEPVGTWLERKPYQPKGVPQQQQELQSQEHSDQQQTTQPETTQIGPEPKAPEAVAEAKAEVFLAAAT
ncbi:hypothetical protein QC764_605190 [Podospora pseudoanserina]|uniref:Uncharacterized protein n=1 Tax=Podospora pseudoanserina TaxID=2609844 RepID=A0ABR0HSW4_9PEZI|nr:hypothetical protein QC764_605190 [Podospora pseudoanserina]